eukprot:4601724-Pleurochrysis_carterae.AAC.1
MSTLTSASDSLHARASDSLHARAFDRAVSFRVLLFARAQVLRLRSAGGFDVRGRVLERSFGSHRTAPLTPVSRPRLFLAHACFTPLRLRELLPSLCTLSSSPCLVALPLLLIDQGGVHTINAGVSLRPVQYI